MTMVAGIGLATKAVRGLEFHRTPREATLSLLAIEGDAIPKMIWEPACGDGAISEILLRAGYAVYSSDIADRGYGKVLDFLNADRNRVAYGVLTNPPFSKAKEFVDAAFSYASVNYCALLLPLRFMESGRRKAWWECRPPARVWVSVSRLPMMHRDGYEGKKSTSAIPMAWHVWLRGYTGDAAIKLFDWHDYVDAPQRKTRSLDPPNLDLFKDNVA